MTGVRGGLSLLKTTNSGETSGNSVMIKRGLISTLVSSLIGTSSTARKRSLPNNSKLARNSKKSGTLHLHLRSTPGLSALLLITWLSLILTEMVCLIRKNAGLSLRRCTLNLEKSRAWTDGVDTECPFSVL
jgi:hypothetical protein